MSSLPMDFLQQFVDEGLQDAYQKIQQKKVDRILRKIETANIESEK